MPQSDLPLDLIGRRVLVAEDVPMIRDLIEILLMREQIVATLVENGAEAVAQAQSIPFDVILMDMQMPVMDRLEATRMIRESDAASARTPIIGLTGNAMTEHRGQCLAAGMTSYVSKPFAPEALVGKIREVLKAAA